SMAVAKANHDLSADRRQSDMDGARGASNPVDQRIPQLVEGCHLAPNCEARLAAVRLMTVVADVQRNSCMANRVIEIDSHRDPVGEAHIPPTGFEDHRVATPTGKCLKRPAEGRPSHRAFASRTPFPP